jgi:hypothetical protein
MQFEDYLAIKNLIHGYPRHADKGDFEGVGRLLGGSVSGMIGEPPGFHAEGAEAFTKVYEGSVRKFPQRGTPRTRHLIGNVVIEPDGPEGAKAESYVMVFQQTDKLPLQAIIGGTYFDTFAKIDGEWRLVERWEDMELIGDLSEHLLHELPGTGHP